MTLYFLNYRGDFYLLQWEKVAATKEQTDEVSGEKSDYVLN